MSPRPKGVKYEDNGEEEEEAESIGSDEITDEERHEVGRRDSEGGRGGEVEFELRIPLAEVK